MPIVQKGDFLLPAEHAMACWPVIACDQFTSQREWWEERAKEVGSRPSALNLILPEVYLEDADVQERVGRIHSNMQQILRDSVLRHTGPCFVYTERTLLSGLVRRGLVCLVDLSAYDPEGRGAIRPTEQTVKERIPPRMQIREGAALELSHVLLLMDDPSDRILGPLERDRTLPVLYDMELPGGGGRLRGCLVSGSSLRNTEEAIAAYESERTEGLMYAVGDGNHSLAAARACMDRARAEGRQGEGLAMVELNNVRDSSMAFEPIHRLIPRGGGQVLEALQTRMPGGTPLRFFLNGQEGRIHLRPEPARLLAEIQPVLDEITDGKMDYIHGTGTLRKLTENGGLGLVMPEITREDFFRALGQGVMPRKTFSIGHALEKRYYMEARKISED